MQNDHREPGLSASRGGSPTVNSLASQAIAVLASRVTAPPPLNARALDKLEEAVFCDDKAARIAVLDAMQASGLSDEEIVDSYIPEVARRLGDQWVSDERSFAEVTIGAARLQAMLRDIAVDWAWDGLTSVEAPTALIVVREGEYHTLGAMVLATQFRRYGVDATVSLGRPDRDVIADIRYGAYDMVAISASEGERLDSLNRLVVKIRSATKSPPPIALGGSILGTCDDLETETGVDFATKDAREALETCGLKISKDLRRPAARLSAFDPRARS